MDWLDGLILGAAAAAIGTMIANKFFNSTPSGGGTPRQGNLSSHSSRTGKIQVQIPSRLKRNSAPVAQNTPITEAAYNVQPTKYSPTLGPQVGSSNNELIMTM